MSQLKLKEFRKKRKLSQRQVAEMLNMSQANYWRFEKGVSLPNSKQILQLSKIFDCTPNDLFGIKGSHIVAFDDLFK